MPRWKTSSGKGVDIAYDGLTRAEIAKEKTYQASKSRSSGPKRSGRKAATRPSSRGTGPKRSGTRRKPLSKSPMKTMAPPKTRQASKARKKTNSGKKRRY